MSTSGEKIFQTDENISEKIFQSLSKRRRPLQHQNLPDPFLPHEPQALPDGPPDLRPEGEKIFQTKENISEKIFQIASYGYTTDDITYKWDTADPVQLAKSLNLPRFNIEKYSSSYCNVKTNTGRLVHSGPEIRVLIYFMNEWLIVLLRQLSYAIKDQLKAPKAPY